MARNERMAVALDLRGLDLVTPVDLLSDGRTPFAKNFRLYAQQSDDRRVAASSRKGPGYYMDPDGEVLVESNESTTGASVAEVGVVAGLHAIPFTAASDDRLTRIDVQVSDPGAAMGPLMVRVYSDDGGPAHLLSESSILSGSIGVTPDYKVARFVNAVKLSTGQTYWITFQIQDDGGETYQLSTTTDGTMAWSSDSGLPGLQQMDYSINYKLYTSPDKEDKGAYRFHRDNGDNITLVAYDTTMYALNEQTKVFEPIATGLAADATEYRFANGDNKVFWVNGYDQLKAWDGTTVETITDTELPILSDIVMHKDRLWGVDANDPNRLVFSENPGNPAYDPTGTTPTTPSEQWYYAWLSVSFIYVPRPHNGSPVTGLVSFQDALTVFTQDKKYVISGYDRGSFVLREATGSKGSLSKRGVAADENKIYFVGVDGLYEYNGSADEKISKLVNPLFDGCAYKDKITPVIYKNEVRFYFANGNQPRNDSCLIYDKNVGEMLLDTDTYVNRALFYRDADDDQELIEFSSLVPVAYLAEKSYHSLGAPIDFEYRLKYDSLGAPAQKKRIRKYFPLLQGVDNTFYIQLAMDKDFEDSPREKNVLLSTNGATLGSFNLGDGTTLGGDKSFKQHRQSYSGYAYYWQLRVIRKGVNNRVAFIGAQFSYKTKRL